jgi:hypothetical protein
MNPRNVPAADPGTKTRTMNRMIAPGDDGDGDEMTTMITRSPVRAT